MGVLKWSVRIHKWVALIVGIQIVLWIAGGLVMSAIPIEQVRGEHKIAAPTPLAFDPAQLQSLQSVTNNLQIEAVSDASLGRVIDAAAWRIKTASGETYLIDARTGARLDPFDEALARKIAEADYEGSGELTRIETLTEPPSEYGRSGPVWQARFDDGDATTLYIDPSTAEVRARRSSTWRFYDFFWKLHVMDYDDGADFNHPLLITAAGAAIFVALSGLVLLIIKMRRSLIAWRRRSVAE